MKADLILIIAIALERISAIYFPTVFRTMYSPLYATLCVLIGLIFGVIDVTLELTMSNFDSVKNCGALGCFLSAKFLSYWGISNMVLGIVIIILTILILLKLRMIKKRSQLNRTIVNFQENKFKQANRFCTGMLISSVMFVTLPSVIVGIFEIMGTSIFGVLGPFSLVGLLCAGGCNSILYLILNKDIRTLARNTCFRANITPIAPTMSVKVFSKTGV
ncbi:hypothetical protein DICVIV_12727 [Dictyocaulus viviparus]|uniref:G-protein coupled receptors family 1 profile domain-containing protein n=1 Tax=Dictyocaulus viviparus TaxID=29172 RepID=A0A0D8XG09_DICVI|nr:hypothetical protein DICVIV_12727 [Dictyocaulus viviparus]